MIERLKLKWRNWRSRKTGQAYRTIVKSMQRDPNYAHSWFCNISMPIYDKFKDRITPYEANEMADKLMQHLFDVKNSRHPQPQPQAPEPPLCHRP